MALRYTAEISYYIDGTFHRQGIATMQIHHAIAACPKLEIKNLIAILLDRNEASIRLLENFGFEKWGGLPNVADFDGEEFHKNS
jgi:L-amino acid N-acyltransferase YncA